MRFKFAILCLCFSSTLFAKTKVVTTIPDLAWLAQQIGGESVDARSLLSGRENPHYVDAVPDFIRQSANADIVCQVGLDLEVGYMPAILSRSGNAKVQTGGNGYCDISASIPVLEKISTPINRSMGDIHPHGNPHFYLSPAAMIFAADEMHKILLKNNVGAKALFDSNLKQLKMRLQKTLDENRAALDVWKDDIKHIAEYHKEFIYFFRDYGFTSFGSLEEKPGVIPSAGRIAEFALAAKKAKVRLLMAADYHPKKHLERFSELSGIPFVQVPTLIQGSLDSNAYETLQRQIVQKMLSALQKTQK